MSTALLVIDVQESFRHRAYFDPAEVPAFLAAQNALIEGCGARGVPIVRVFHVAPEGPFARASGHVRPLEGLLDFAAATTVYKERHSALAGTGLEAWLRGRGIDRVIVSGIRTEQCCETTARAASDAGFVVDFVTEATLTWAMWRENGSVCAPAALREHTELVLAGRFASIVSVREALARCSPPRDVATAAG
jgi:nicotinamidase-related amidase